MNCPKCGKDTNTIDSRPCANNEVRRRRKCVNCGYRFTTYEMTAVAKAILEQGATYHERKSN